ncbi:hypothetical protein KSP40_PGU004295 [Platanthera guangdongensis]|uniref:Uncharacterized protein n=1 Tax=Platanthera guangdongensis TaxID=2320717 RepID=A0ABR2MI28_9ASPA
MTGLRKVGRVWDAQRPGGLGRQSCGRLPLGLPAPGERRADARVSCALAEHTVAHIDRTHAPRAGTRPARLWRPRRGNTTDQPPPAPPFLRCAAEIEVEGCILRKGRSVIVTCINFRIKESKKLAYTARSTYYVMPVASL